MTTAIQVCHGALDDAARGDAVFSGALVIFTKVKGLDAFCDRVDELVRAGFGVEEPERAQFAMSRVDYLEAVRTVQKMVRADEVAHHRLLDALRSTGMGENEAYWDWVHLRVLPSGEEFATSGTGWHRDTWASSIAAQTNWWTPIYPVTAERTITFAPAYWSTPVANSSPSWAPSSEQVIPRPVDALAPYEQRVVIEPGDLLCFSGAQLHSTVPNETGRARFSVEVRTVSRTDVQQQRGAPAVDETAPVPRYGWFHHVADGSSLPRPSCCEA